jgi:thymidylate synthase (FAD)
MTLPYVLKTSDECLLKLVGHTMMVDYDDEELPARKSAALLPVHAARASFGKEDKTGADEQGDKKLMFFLAREGHTSVFEHQSATFLIECPLFIRSQIMRHRTFSYNEISRRYTSEQLGFWKPDVYRKQDPKAKQCSSSEVLSEKMSDLVEGDYERHIAASFYTYDNLLQDGVAREQARAALPQSLLTRFYMTGNLRNWAHFLSLRLDKHAQPEVQIIAQKIHNELVKLWPLPMQALMEEYNAID